MNNSPIDTYKEKAELIIADHDDQFCGEGESAPTDPVTLKRLEAAALDLVKIELVNLLLDLEIITMHKKADATKYVRLEYLLSRFNARITELENRRKEIEE